MSAIHEAPPDGVHDASLDGPVVLSVCVNCRAEGDTDDAKAGAGFFAALRDAAAAADAPISVRPVQCLSVCKRPCTVALSSPGRYTYMFGDLASEAGITALLDGAKTYAELAHGYMLWRERPEPLRRGIIARIPPLDWNPEDGRHPR
jgi:predicted metal-binding protein